MAEQIPPTDIVDRHRAAIIEVDSDTCDACPADAKVQASVYIRMPSGGTVTMCGHHGERHRDALVAQGAEIIDMSHWATS